MGGAAAPNGFLVSPYAEVQDCDLQAGEASRARFSRESCRKDVIFPAVPGRCDQESRRYFRRNCCRFVVRKTRAGGFSVAAGRISVGSVSYLKAFLWDFNRRAFSGEQSFEFFSRSCVLRSVQYRRFSTGTHVTVFFCVSFGRFQLTGCYNFFAICLSPRKIPEEFCSYRHEITSGLENPALKFCVSPAYMPPTVER